MEIIAEIGQNHNGDMDLARRLIVSAKENGADVAKFQVFEARKIFQKDGNPWFDYNLRTELKRDQVEMLAEECARIGIEFMASVFDVERIAWLEAVGVKRYKVASRSLSDKDLLAALTATGKPLIVSLGFWTGEGFPVIEAPGGVQWLHCVSKYPTPLSDVGLSRIDFSVYAGFSDHTIGLTAPMAAFARGARIIEKHFTIDKDLYGPDHSGSMTPDELATLARYRDDLRACL
jgi:sialic acid synthase SpsE